MPGAVGESFDSLDLIKGLGPASAILDIAAGESRTQIIFPRDQKTHPLLSLREGGG